MRTLLRTRDPKLRALESVPFFQACSRSELTRIAPLVDEVSFSAGDHLTREGRTGRECFVIAEGEAAVDIGGVEVAVFMPGDIAGEMSLVDRLPRSGTVTALSPLRAYVISQPNFRALLEVSPAVTRRVLAALTSRLRTADAEVVAAASLGVRT